MNEVDFYLEDLKSKFKKINPKEYYLSYSGGKDSHLLWWFLKVWLRQNDFNMWAEYLDIEIVGVNTYMEHPDILFRIYKNCNVVVRSKMKPFEIKEKYGSPCFSKFQDEMIDRYQKGNRSENTMSAITGEGRTIFKLNNTAKELLLSGELHRVSGKCCEHLKKMPVQKYEKETGRKPILGIMASESKLRKAQYKSCFTKKRTFTPIFDLTEELSNAIHKQYGIEIPKIYDHLNQTGCMGCPYGSYKGNTQTELEFVTDNQYKFLWEYHKESYEVLGIKKVRRTRLF